MAETQSYNHFIIQQYLQHKMTPQEMHAFEKALMDDPFLADAVEGFAAANQTLAEKDVAEIEYLVANKKEESKVVPLPAKKMLWWRVAAIVLVIVTGGIISYSLLNKNGTNKDIALQTTTINESEAGMQQDSTVPAEKSFAPMLSPAPQAAAPQSNNPSYKAESNALAEDHLTRQKKSAEDREAIVKIKKSLSANLENENKADSVVAYNVTSGAARIDGRTIKDNAAAAQASPAPTQSPALSKSMASPSTQMKNAFRGKVIDENGQEVSGALIAVKDNRSATMSDNQGNFTLQVPDSLVQVQVSSIGYSTAVAQIRSNLSSNVIKLSQRTETPGEVAVTSVILKRKARLLDGKTNGAEPEGGWKNFDQYMNRRIDSLKSANDNPGYQSDVVLEFVIDNFGRPTDIKPAENTNKTAADMAVGILSNGPKWKNKKREKKVKVVIPFKD